MHITGETESSLNASITVRRKMDTGLAIVLCLCCLVPGLIYIAIVNSRTDTFSAHVRIDVEDGVTVVTWGGAGPALDAAISAVRLLPAA